MEKAYGVPPESLPSKKVLASEALKAVVEAVAKSEKDFDYQYEYNEKLVKQVADQNKLLNELKFDLATAKQRLSDVDLELVAPWRTCAVLGWISAFVFAGSFGAAIFYGKFLS